MGSSGRSGTSSLNVKKDLGFLAGIAAGFQEKVRGPFNGRRKDIRIINLPHKPLTSWWENAGSGHFSRRERND
jgi:hypothetical protein